MAKQWTSQFGDALRAFAAALEALTWPDDLGDPGETVFTNEGRWSAADPADLTSSVAFAYDNEEPDQPLADYPQAIIRLQTWRFDDDNQSRRIELQIALEIRTEGGQDNGAEAALFGRNKSAVDDPFGAGLVDLVAKVGDEVGHWTTGDDAEATDSFIAEGGGSFPTKGDGYDFATINYTANIRLWAA